jgi:hypothetical protein
MVCGAFVYVTLQIITFLASTRCPFYAFDKQVERGVLHLVLAVHVPGDVFPVPLLCELLSGSMFEPWKKVCRTYSGWGALPHAV